MLFGLNNELDDILTVQSRPCISVYMPTFATFPEEKQNRIRFKNLLNAVEDKLSAGYPEVSPGRLLVSLQKLEEDSYFWSHQLRGLGIFIAPEYFNMIRFRRSVDELVVVSDSFHIKPLIRCFQSADRFQILSLTQNEVKIYEGDRYGIDEIDRRGVPKSLDEALDEDYDPEQRLNMRSLGMNAGAPRVSGFGSQVFSGMDDGSEKNKNDLRRFFIAVDRCVHDLHSKVTNLPLILAAVDEHHDPFRKISKNKRLWPEGIRKHPGSLSTDQMLAEAWQLLEPSYLSKTDKLRDEFRNGQPHGKSSDDLRTIAGAASDGRVATLVLDADRQIFGSLSELGLDVNAGSDKTHDDLLDDLAELALSKKSEVVVLPSDRMPTTSGAAAIFRY
jgi:hypothetical protein